MSKGGHTAIDLFSVKQVKACLHTLDTEFKWYHMDVIDLMDDDTEIDKERDVMDECKSRVIHISCQPQGTFFSRRAYNQDRKHGTKCCMTTPC